MAQAFGALGTILAVSDNAVVTTIDTEAEFFNVGGFDDVGLIENFGEFGKVFDLVTFQPVQDGRTYKLKGGYNSGTMQLTIGADLSDAGQAVLYDNANDASQARVVCRVTLNDAPSALGGGSRYYFLAMPMSWRETVGSVNNPIRAMVTMEVDGEIIYTYPAQVINNYTTGEDLSAWATFKGSDPQAILPTINGSVWDFVTGNAGTGFAVDGVEAVGATGYEFQAQDGKLVFEADFSFDSFNNGGFFIGFTDNNASLENPIEMPSGSLVTNASDAVGILFDSGAGDSSLRGVGVNNDVDETSVVLGTHTTTTSHIYRVEVTSAGTASFYRDGVLLGSMTTALRTNVNIYAVITAVARNTSSRTLTVGNSYLRQDPI